MKKIILSLSITLVISLCNIISLSAQEDFGTDVVVKNTSTENQRKVSLSIASNGWIFAAFVTNSGSNSGYEVYKSTNNGQNWSSFVSSTSTTNTCVGVKVLVCGEAPYKVFVCKSRYANSTQDYHLYISEYNGTTGEYVATPWELFTTNWKIYDFDMATDYTHPGVGTDPYSVGILYSRGGPNDSVKFVVSTNGGSSFNTAKIVNTSVNWFGKVSLAYGRCQNYNGGRYFAVWEAKTAFNAPLGRIGYSRTGNGVQTSFITPIYLDNVAGIQNKCCNPKIACQSSGVNNDSTNITAVVLVEQWYSDKDNDIIGWCNKKAATTNNFWATSLNTTAINAKQPDIKFSEYNSGFFVTYWDSTNKYLPFLWQTFNMLPPNNWTTLSSHFNDNTSAGSLLQPFPVIETNPSSNQYAFLWAREGSSANGVVLFDLTNYTVSITNNDLPKRLINTFPNPTMGVVNVELSGFKDNIQIQLINSLGSLLYETNKKIIMDNDRQTIDISTYPNGIYFIKVIQNEQTYINKIIKN